MTTPQDLLNAMRKAVDLLVEMNNDQREEGKMPEADGAEAEYQARKALSSLGAHLNS